MIDELIKRGLLADLTGDGELEDILSKDEKITLYCGFDPTADSLHVGSLLPLINMKRFADKGHHVIALIGGATGFIGDPSFKSKERQLNTAETIDLFKIGIEKQIRFILGDKVTIVDNLSWTKNINVIDFLRDIGKHFTVNSMMNKESVKQRLDRDGDGMSFTEFSYQLLQGMDFLKLKEIYGCMLQIGGSDQMGNITAGTGLIHKVMGSKEPAFGLTTKLLTKSDGEKFGKSESGTVWLSDDKTSAFDFFQFWLKTPDSDVYDFLKFFSFMSVDEIDILMNEDRNRKPLAQDILAKELTLLVHGETGLKLALSVTKAIKDNEFKLLTKKELEIVSSALLTIEIKDESISLVDALVDSGLSKSKRESREFIKDGAIMINGLRELKDDFLIKKENSALMNKFVFIKKGKRNLAAINFI